MAKETKQRHTIYFLYFLLFTFFVFALVCALHALKKSCFYESQCFVLFPPHTRWSFGILLYELITLGKVLSYLPKFYSTFPSYLNPNLLITTIKPLTTLQSQ